MGGRNHERKSVVGAPIVSDKGNFYKVETDSMPRQHSESFECERHSGEIILDKTCKELPPQRVVKKCLSETQSVWLEGYGKPMYSVYVCEDTLK